MEHDGIIRLNTQDEAVTQIVGLMRLLNGGRTYKAPSNHHVFEFKAIPSGIRIICITKDDPVDIIDLSRDEAAEFIHGYVRCIGTRYVTPSDDDDLFPIRDALIDFLGEVPPLLKKTPEQWQHEKWEKLVDTVIALSPLPTIIVVFSIIMHMIG